jgi:hypothetical protein
MTNFTAPQLERNLVDSKVIAKVVPTNVSTEVIADSIAKNEEYAYIELFNAGVNNAYYAFGRTCDTAENFNGWIVPGQMLEVVVREAVNIFSVGGTTIAITMLKRRTQIQNIQYPA